MSCSADTKVAGRSLRHDVVPHVAAHNTHQERLKISLVAPTRLFNNIGQTAKNSTGANLVCYTALSGSRRSVWTLRRRATSGRSAGGSSESVSDNVSPS